MLLVCIWIALRCVSEVLDSTGLKYHKIKAVIYLPLPLSLYSIFCAKAFLLFGLNQTLLFEE